MYLKNYLRQRGAFKLLFYVSFSLMFVLLLTQSNQPRRQSDGEIVDQKGKTFDFIENIAEDTSSDARPPPALSSFYVYSDRCKIPRADAFTPELLAIFKPQKYENCTTEPDLISLIYDNNLRRYILHINMEVGQALLNDSSDSFICCYNETVRKPYDKGKALPCEYFGQDTVVPHNVNGMVVKCHSQRNSSRIIQEDAFPLVQYPNATTTTTTTTRFSRHRRRQPSVMMIGIDSLSRINIRRNMPNTCEYLKRNQWYEMEGYNKVGDNTFPNLIALLTGLSLESHKNVCDSSQDGGLDRCPFVWKYFKNAGYHTAMAEDEGGMSTFNYCKRGFKYPPVDYYLRPFVHVIDDYLPEYKRFGGLRYCLGRRHCADYIYGYGTQFAQRFIDEPNFGLFWTNTFSHNYYDSSASMDDKMVGYLEVLEQTGVLQNSIVIFLSDHGMRYGQLLDLPEGFLEERLPMLYIWLPQWFKDEYPAFANSLRINRNRLSSPYDLHMTLQHIAHLNIANAPLPSAADCPLCQSLFHTVPESRSCEEAGIAEHWCTCEPFEVITKYEKINKIATLIVDEMNVYVQQKKNLSNLCEEIKFDSVKYAEQKLEFVGNDRVYNRIEQTYRIKFKTKPNDATFQTTVTYNVTSETVVVNVEDITRLNSYANDSKCIKNDKQAMKYCFCYQNVTTPTSITNH